MMHSLSSAGCSICQCLQPAWHCSGTSLGHPRSSSAPGETAALFHVRKGFSPNGETQLQPFLLPRPGAFGAVSLQEGLISPRFQPEGPRTGSPPPRPLCKEQPCSCLLAGNGASLAENGSAFAQKIPTVNELPEITILKQVLAVLYKLRSVCVVLKRHRRMCCSFHAK